MIEQNYIWRKCGNVKNLCPFPFFQASGGLKAFGNYLAEDYFFAQVRNTWYLKCNLNCNKRNILNVICHLCNWMMSLLDMPNMCLHTFIYYVIACLKYLEGIVGRVIHEQFNATPFLQAVLNSGHSINISSQPAWQNSGNGGVSVFQSRITR